ncbi:MAG: hypothetical protein EAZ89_02370, partial [Bacteroidetes bacterium]
PTPAKDSDIWNYAAAHNLIIVTFDEDFSDFLSVKGAPPKIVWLRTGNLPTPQIAEKLLAAADLISSLYSDPQTDLIEIY